MLKDACELDVIEIPLFVNRCFSVQLVHFLVCKPVSHCGQQFSQVILLNGAWRIKKWRSEETLLWGIITRSIYHLTKHRVYVKDYKHANVWNIVLTWLSQPQHSCLENALLLSDINLLCSTDRTQQQPPDLLVTTTNPVPNQKAWSMMLPQHTIYDHTSSTSKYTKIILFLFRH